MQQDLTLKYAGNIGSITGYLRSRDVQEMLSDAQRRLRDNPVPALAASTAFGFLVGVLLRRY